MMAAVHAASSGHKVLLLEKNEKLGKKIYITGKGRCNLTNACETEDLFRHVLRNQKFLYSAFYNFTNLQAIGFFESHGLATKTERGGRVFPVSGHSSDVIRALQQALQQAGVEVRLHTNVQEVLTGTAKACGGEPHVTGVCLSDGTILHADAVIIATGGCSYCSTGSTGDGYRFARELGHAVTELRPSLVPFETAEPWVKDLQGLSLKNVTVRIRHGSKTIYEDFGEMLFTHFGVSGPLVLSASGRINDYMEQMPLQMEIDLKPALSVEQLDKRILRDFEDNRNRQFKNGVQKLFPSKLIPVIVA